MSNQRIPSLEREQATGKTREILDGIQASLGRIPNLVSVMANSPATLQGYVALEEARRSSRLLSDEEMLRNRGGTSHDARTEVALRFAQHIVRTQAQVSDDDLTALRKAGYSDGEIIEIVFNVVANILTNYINHIAGTLVDFPQVPSLAAQAA